MKKAFMVIIYILTAAILSVTAFINVSPEFGANPTRSQKKVYENFPNYSEGEFKNIEETVLMTGDMSMKDFFKSDSNRTPDGDIIPRSLDLDTFLDTSDHKVKLSWLGHSSFIINLNGKTILLDPMFGQYAGPVPLPSLRRYSSQLAFEIEDLQQVDVVIFSHDHYDHLDRGTIKQLKDKVKLFVVPHGVGSHLRSWGVDRQNIVELNWEESFVVDEIELICLPSRHFSGRGPFNRNSTLWGSWALKSPHAKIYFSGDSGYGSHFGQIGEQHGPFDLTLLDCAQYNVAWKYSHMFPEQAIRAAKDLKSRYFMPIHWGAFTLSVHAWDEPVERAIVEAKQQNQSIIVPYYGDIVAMDKIDGSIVEWWNRY